MLSQETKRFSIYWDKRNRAPYIADSFCGQNISNDSSFVYMATDLRPVFSKEKVLLRKILPSSFPSLTSSVWADASNNFFVDGQKVKASVISTIRNFSFDDVIEDGVNIPDDDDVDIFQRFVDVNRERLNYILYSEDKDAEGWSVGAEPFIQEVVAKYPRRTPFVSFSGGKDSTVVSSLATKALNNPSVIHIFGDTTLEMRETYEYIERFQRQHDLTPFLSERNDSTEFIQLCKRIGPPSRVKRWCCSIFKTGPMGTTLADMNIDLLTFYGVRRAESTSRSKYKRVASSPKLKKQIVASPIIDWNDIDVWLYLLSQKIDFNHAYHMGFSRVGCWCCPNNSSWSDVLMRTWHPNEYHKWRNFLVDFAMRIGKPDPEVYVDDGKWKARQGGNGLDSSTTKINSKTCTTEDNTLQYTMTRSLDVQFYEMFKPFGTLDFSMGKKRLSEVYVLGRDNQVLLKISGSSGDKVVRISIVGDFNKNFNSKVLNRGISGYINRQICKYQSCINCMACNSVCPTSAIEVTPCSYTINEKKCFHCLKCIMHFDKGCLVASALATRKDDL